MNGPLCERCGRCLEVCPTYQVTRVETLGPRARFELIEAVRGGTLAGGPRYRHTLSQCLQCLACSRACPKGVDVAGQVVAAREERLAREGGETLKRLGLLAVLRGRPALAALARLARPLAALLPRRPGSPSRHLPLFLPEALAGRAVPPLAPRRLPRVVPPAPGAAPRGPVTLFTGCFF
ncbi:MAG: 4Fe-4S dicluster domain-containing protein, partial [Deferrisomatales bacterium]